MERTVNKWLGQWNTNTNPPEYYKPYRVEDYLVVLGKSGGLVVFGLGEYLSYRRVLQYEGDYWIECDGPEEKDVLDLSDEIAIHTAALKYCKLYATKKENMKGDLIAYTLPWYPEKQNYSKEL